MKISDWRSELIYMVKEWGWPLSVKAIHDASDETLQEIFDKYNGNVQAAAYDIVSHGL